MVEVHDQLLDWTYENVPFHILTINSFVKVYEVMGGYYETGYRPPTTNEFWWPSLKIAVEMANLVELKERIDEEKWLVHEWQITSIELQWTQIHSRLGTTFFK